MLHRPCLPLLLAVVASALGAVDESRTAAGALTLVGGSFHPNCSNPQGGHRALRVNPPNPLDNLDDELSSPLTQRDIENMDIKGVTGNLSAVDEMRVSYYSREVDFATPEPAISICAGCGTIPEDALRAARLPTLAIERVHRYRDVTKQSSLGPGVFLSCDNNLMLSLGNATTGAGSIRLFMASEVFEVQLSSGTPVSVYGDNRNRAIKELRLLTDTGADADQRNATRARLTLRDHRIFEYDIIRTDPNPAATTKWARVTREIDRNGNSITFTYVFAPTATDAQLGNDRSKLWQIATIRDARNQVATVHYRPTTLGGRQVISAIDVPGGTITYTYEGVTPPGVATAFPIAGLSRVRRPDGSTTTISLSLDNRSQCQVVTFAESKQPGRTKNIHLTLDSWTNPNPPNEVRSQSGRLVRAVVETINGVEILRYVNFFLALPSGEQSFNHTDGVGPLFRLRATGEFVRGFDRADTYTLAGAPAALANQPFVTVESYGLDSFRRVTRITTSAGATLASLDAVSGAILKVTRPDSTTSTRTFGAFKFFPPERDVDTRSGATIVRTFDAKANLLSEAVTIGATTTSRSFTYNSRGQPASFTDQNNVTRFFRYDARFFPIEYRTTP